MQIVHKQGRRVVAIDHIGSAHDEAQLALLMEIARQRLHEGQGVLDLAGTRSGAKASRSGARVSGMRSRLLWDVLAGAYARLGFDAIADETFKALVLARLIEATSKADKADSLRVLEEIGFAAPALRTVFRALGRCVERDYRNTLAKACLVHSASTDAGRASLGALRRHHAVVRVRVRVRDRG